LAVGVLSALALALPGSGGSGTSLLGSRICDFGRPLQEKVILRPRPTTFYSVDVLNPDVVKSGGRYLLFFSGNRSRTAAGDWRTGLATAPRPLGPWRVDTRMHTDFLNGGTAWVAQAFYQAASSPRGPAVFRSVDGLRWRFWKPIPQPRGESWRRLESDFSLSRAPEGLRLFFAGRPSPSGADIGTARYGNGSWRDFRRIIVRTPGTWDSVDLGEPASFRARGRTYMVYSGLGANGKARHVGLAYATSDGWHRCAGPFIRAGERAYPQNAIDPEPLVTGNRLFIFFGGGRRPSLGANMNGVIVVRSYSLR
jgi:hypothetical protein